MLYGVVPECDDCIRPTLAPVNLLAWEIYRTLAGGFSQDFHLDLFQLFRLYGVQREGRMLAKLNLIYTEARKNAKQSSGQ